MLGRIGWKKFVAWKAFDEIEPIGGRRLDYLAASIVSTLVNLRRNVERYPDPFPLTDFLLHWDPETAPKPKATKGKSWQQLKFMGQMLAGMYNSAEEDFNKKRRRKKG